MFAIVQKLWIECPGASIAFNKLVANKGLVATSKCVMHVANAAMVILQDLAVHIFVLTAVSVVTY